MTGETQGGGAYEPGYGAGWNVSVCTEQSPSKGAKENMLLGGYLSCSQDTLLLCSC